MGLSQQELIDGPSPRARGTRQRAALRYGRWRSIPACAGNTTLRRRAIRSIPVHPRVRGEHALTEPSAAPTTGPSPRARGTPGREQHPAAGVRSIPACAGNTAESEQLFVKQTVHPRVRGEHAWSCATRLTATRSIPACAGNTEEKSSPHQSPAVHPRVRGEHIPERMPMRLHVRSIPACAGNTDL